MDEERLANELVATGALFAVLMRSETVTVDRIVEGEETAALIVRFPFLRTPYRVTVTMAPEEKQVEKG
jgi:hypothetical protein